MLMIRSNNGMHQQSLTSWMLRWVDESLRTTTLDSESTLNLEAKQTWKETNLKVGALNSMNGYPSILQRFANYILIRNHWQEVARKLLNHMKSNWSMIPKIPELKKAKSPYLQWYDQRKIDQLFSFICLTFLEDMEVMMKSSQRYSIKIRSSHLNYFIIMLT